MLTQPERESLLKDALLASGVAQTDLGEAISRLNSENPLILNRGDIIESSAGADSVVGWMQGHPVLSLLWPAGSVHPKPVPKQSDEPAKPAPRRFEADKKGVLLLTREQLRDHGTYVRAKAQAQRDGVDIVVDDGPDYEIQPGLGRDQDGLPVYGIRQSDIRDVREYERHKAEAARHAARVIFIKES